MKGKEGIPDEDIEEMLEGDEMFYSIVSATKVNRSPTQQISSQDQHCTFKTVFGTVSWLKQRPKL